MIQYDFTPWIIKKRKVVQKSVTWHYLPGFAALLNMLIQILFNHEAEVDGCKCMFNQKPDKQVKSLDKNGSNSQMIQQTEKSNIKSDISAEKFAHWIK